MGGIVPLSRHLMNTVLSNLIRAKKKNERKKINKQEKKFPFTLKNSLYITR